MTRLDIQNEDSQVNRVQYTAKLVCKVLENTYSIIRLDNKKNPLDEYLYIILSIRTHEKGFKRAYQRFKARFRKWCDAADATESEIAEVIRPAGLATQKSRRIKEALEKIQQEFGEISLRKLKLMPPDSVEAFLMSLPGIGLKSARCIMMYSLGLQVLPVDTHVARISRRIGLISHVENKKAHHLLEEIIPPPLRFSFHVTCMQHGRLTCRGQYPKCDKCCLLSLCKTRQKQTRQKDNGVRSSRAVAQTYI